MISRGVQSQARREDGLLAGLDGGPYTSILEYARRGILEPKRSIVNCPACKGIVVIVEYERIELDYCTNCSGVWFDAGELELLAERLSLDGEAFSLQDVMTLPDAKVSEKPRRCPICGKKMRKVHVGEEPRVLLDACPRQDGIWFDSGEVSQVLSQLKSRGPAVGKQGRMINFLGEAFKAK